MHTEQTGGRRRRTKRLRVSLAIVVTVAAMGWVLWRTDLSLLPDLLVQVNVPWLLLGLLLRTISLLLRASRYRAVLKAALGRVPVYAIGSTFMGGLFTQILPFRGGEAVRIGLLRRHNEASVLKLAATVGLERLLDLLIICGGLLAATLLVPLPPWLEGAGLTVSLSAVGVLLIVLFGRALARAICGRLPAPIAEHAESFVDGLDAVRDRRGLLWWGVLTGVGWFFEVLAVSALLVCFDVHLGLPVALLLTCATALGMGVPAGPAGLGPHQFVHVALLGMYGVNSELALAVSVVGSLSTTLLLALVAGICLLLFGREDALPSRVNPSA